MSGLPFVTIDPPGARDLDQALHIERRGDGHRVSYAIADVAAFVEPGDAADVAAWKQGVTIYHPDRQEPLHPDDRRARVAAARTWSVPPCCGRSTSTPAAP